MSPSRKSPEYECNRTIVLVGMMGAGKTTIGRRLASCLGLPFHDADQEIEKASGMTVSELFQTHGEESFREGEARVIKRLLEGKPHVLATGGGAPTHPDTRRLIAENAVSVWLKADLEILLKRATKRSTRPLLQTGDPRETLTRLLAEREPFYAEADIQVESQAGPHVQTVSLIIDELSAYLTIKETSESQDDED